MIDLTNSLPVVSGGSVLSNPLALQSTFNAWHVVAIMVGGIVIHFYHAVVNAGGYEMIWRRFRFGPEGRPEANNTNIQVSNIQASNGQMPDGRQTTIAKQERADLEIGAPGAGAVPGAPGAREVPGIVGFGVPRLRGSPEPPKGGTPNPNPAGLEAGAPLSTFNAQHLTPNSQLCPGTPGAEEEQGAGTKFGGARGGPSRTGTRPTLPGLSPHADAVADAPPSTINS